MNDQHKATLIYEQTAIANIDCEPWLGIYRGTEKNDTEDYVVAGRDYCQESEVDLVKPGESYTAPEGWDLDCFIYRDGTSTKFEGYFGREIPYTVSETKTKFSQYIADAQQFFNKTPVPK